MNTHTQLSNSAEQSSHTFQPAGNECVSTAPIPVLQLFAANAHGPLVALSNAHLVPAAFHFLAGILGGVQT